jgi:hypothetical protein
MRVKRSLVLVTGVLAILSLAGAGSNRAAGPPEKVSVLVHLEPGVDRPGVRQAVAALGGRIHYEYQRVLRDTINVRDLPAPAVAALERIPGVRSVEPDRIVEALMRESVPLIRATDPSVAGVGIDGTGVRVCIVDTGINYSFSGYIGRIVAGASFVSYTQSPQDDHGHGSFVAAVVASSDAVYRGVAPNASLMAAKVLDSTGHGFSSDVVMGIDWCALSADVINLSLGDTNSDGTLFGGTCDGNSIAMAANEAVNGGVVVVAASGNDCSKSGMRTPACASKVIAVGATYDGALGSQSCNCCTDTSTATDQVTCFSDASSALDIVAPGSLISYNFWQNACGTSVAAPHVSGAAALLLHKQQALTPTQVASALYNNTDPATGTGAGRGRVNVKRALDSIVTVCGDGVCNGGEGAACCRDCDADGDGAYGVCDNCPAIANPGQANSDADALGDACDNCPLNANPTQADWNHDGQGDACDDTDGDTITDDVDNCRLVANRQQRDGDGDGVGDDCDNCPARANADQADFDRDGVGDTCDNCWLSPNPDQADTDGNGVGDLCEPSPAPDPACCSTGAGSGPKRKKPGD